MSVGAVPASCPACACASAISGRPFASAQSAARRCSVSAAPGSRRASSAPSNSRNSPWYRYHSRRSSSATSSRFECSSDRSTSADPVASSSASHSGPLRRSTTDVRVRNSTSSAERRAEHFGPQIVGHQAIVAREREARGRFDAARVERERAEVQPDRPALGALDQRFDLRVAELHAGRCSSARDAPASSARSATPSSGIECRGSRSRDCGTGGVSRDAIASFAPVGRFTASSAMTSRHSGLCSASPWSSTSVTRLHRRHRPRESQRRGRAIVRLPGLSAPEDLRIHRLDPIERRPRCTRAASPGRCRARRATATATRPRCVRPIARATSTCRIRRGRRPRSPSPAASRSGGRRARRTATITGRTTGGRSLESKRSKPAPAHGVRRAAARSCNSASGVREAIGVPPVRRTADRSPACARWPRCRGHAELLVDRDRLRLHRVSRHVQPLADLGEAEMRRQERQQPQLRGRERQHADGSHAHRVEARVRRLRRVRRARPGPDVAAGCRVPRGAPAARRSCRRAAMYHPHELEQRLHRDVRHRVRQERSEREPRAAAYSRRPIDVTLVECDTCDRCIGQGARASTRRGAPPRPSRAPRTRNLGGAMPVVTLDRDHAPFHEHDRHRPGRAHGLAGSTACDRIVSARSASPSSK